jgi:transposase
LPPALAVDLADLTARLSAVQQRIAAIEAALVRVAQPLPAYPLLRSIPGVGPTLAAILLAEIGDIAWYSRFSQLRKLAGFDIVWVATGQWTGTARISKAGRPLLRWALFQAALGAARTPCWRARREALLAKRRRPARFLQGDGGARSEAPPPRLGDLAEWPTLRSRAGRG